MKGMTWNHARGIDPLVAASEAWAAMNPKEGGAAIVWEARSLQDFEAWPLDDLARRYDLIVIDHPHVGMAADANVLRPFEGGLTDMAQGSIGESFASYRWAGRQWALPIDAAAQVMARSLPDLAHPPTDWGEILRMAAQGRVGLPMREPHALMSLMTLCGLCGILLDADAPDLFPDEACEAWERLAELFALCGPQSAAQDPIAVLEAMADPFARLVLAPLIYGYINYAMEGFRPHRLAFSDLVPVHGGRPQGSVLGGTGIAVSAFSAHGEEAERFALWLASGPVQRDLVARHGGQAGHDSAWCDGAANAASGDFYRATRATLDHSWLRPRHATYIEGQQKASAYIVEAMQKGARARSALFEVNTILRRK